MGMSKNTIDTFWKRIDRKSPDECWLWTADNLPMTSKFRLEGKVWDVHRLAYHITIHHIDKYDHISHICGNILCCNPNHMIKTDREKRNSLSIETFWKKIKIGNIEECWPWQSYINENGYGVACLNSKRFYSHRISYSLYYGDISNDIVICHKCDNPPCCNPNHLFAGSREDNVKDMVSKNRTALGERHSHAILTEQQVIDMRLEYATGKVKQYDLAKKYNISKSHVSAIITRKYWTHIM